jgi:Fe-S-cluster-containing dehydrogenase component
MKALIIDASKCNGCYNCQIACKDEHVGNDWSPYAKPQPLTGHFWIRVTDIVRGTFPKVKVSYKHDICQHCGDAPCISACKRKAIDRRDDGIVIIRPEACRGDRNCVEACPYGVIYFNENLNIAQKCTFCAHLLDRGAKVPRCVDVCPTGALTFGEEEELKDLIDRAEIIEPPGLVTRPRVYYIALPKRFIAGAIYDPSEDECIEGALATLTLKEDGSMFTTTTDEFGDFWFEGLKVADYSLSIEREGYGPHFIESVNTERDVNLGDIALMKRTP